MKSDRTNEDWLADLREPGPAQEDALEALRTIVRAGLPYALSSYLSPTDPQFDDLADEVTQDTLIRVLDRLGTFEGRSKFTTWVHKIAVRLALTELRRKRWQDVSLEALTETESGEVSYDFMADMSADPALSAEQVDLVAQLRRVILDELTERQRAAIIATQIRGMPMDVVARKMGMKRNALYKLLHDGRKRLKERMGAMGLDPEDVIESFERG